MLPQLAQGNKSSAIDSLLTRLTKLLFSNRDPRLSDSDRLTLMQPLIDKEIKDITTDLIKKAPYYPGSTNNFYATVVLIENTLTLTLSEDLKRFIRWYDIRIGDLDWEGDTISPPIEEDPEVIDYDEKLNRLFAARKELLAIIKHCITLPDGLIDSFMEQPIEIIDILNSHTKLYLDYWKNKYRDLLSGDFLDYGVEVSNKGTLLPGMGQMFISVRLTPALETFLKGDQ